MRNVTFYALRNKIYMVFDALEAKSGTAFSDVITVTFSNMLNATSANANQQMLCFRCWILDLVIVVLQSRPEPKQH